MTIPFRRARGQATPTPVTISGLLSQAEVERVARFKRVYEVQGAFELDCLHDAEVMVNRLEFVQWVHQDELKARR